MQQITRCLLLIFLTSILLTSAAGARRNPNEVLIVYNANSSVSTAVAKYYASKRHITNIVAVRCADSALNATSETIGYADYSVEIAAPVRKFLRKHRWINFIVLTKGMPLRINGALTGEYAQPSLDSYLAAIDYPTISGAVKANLAGSGTVGTGWINRYYNANVPFSHAKFGGYLVTRLDGYTEADAISLVDESLAAEKTPTHGDILLDIEPDFGVGDKAAQPTATAATTVLYEEAYGNWNADMLHAADNLEASGIPNDTDVTQTFVGQQSNVAGYFSWGSNDSHYNYDAYESLRFAPGSIGDTAVSTSARTFLPTSGGQSLMADLIAHGLTCCQGYAGEPILDGISSPTIDLTYYLSGYTMAESFYAGTKYIGWEGVCVGDPLCCPYPSRKLTVPKPAAAFAASSEGVKTESCSESGLDVCSISDGDYTAYDNIDFDGATSFKARVAGKGPGGNIELRLDSVDGLLAGTCAVPPTGEWQLWTTATCGLYKTIKGKHALYLVYRGQGSNLFNVEWFSLQTKHKTSRPILRRLRL